MWHWLNVVSKAIGDMANFRHTQEIYMVGKLAENLDTAINLNSTLIEQREELKLAQFKFQYIQKIKKPYPHINQTEISYEQAAKEARLTYDKTKDLQNFIKLVEEAKQQPHTNFERWCWQQKKALQLDVLERSHKLQQELASYQRQSALKITEERKKLENSPTWLVASEILNSNQVDELVPLRVFLILPQFKINQKILDIELQLAESLRTFFKKYAYQKKFIDLVNGVWINQQYHHEISIKALFSVLRSEPTLILESEVDGKYLNFRIAYWGLNWSKYRYEPIISKLPYLKILNEFAKARTLKWQETKAKLIADGEDSVALDNIYGQDYLKNLQVLEQEGKFIKAGIDIDEIELSYIIHEKDLEQLVNLLNIYHYLIAGLIADEYFLLQYNLPPQLPQLLPDLLKDVPDTQIIHDLIREIVLYNQKLYQELGKQQNYWMPELALGLAESLANFPIKTWAKGQIIYSIKSWLDLHGLPQINGLPSLIKIMESALTIADLGYVQKLNKSLVEIGETYYLNVEDACYQRGLKSYQAGEYIAAIRDFNQTIEINGSSSKAYYYRGLSYTKLVEYQKAIADYNQVLQLNNQSAEVYYQRGYAYQQIAQYEQAIADYEQALKINPNFPDAIQNQAQIKQILADLAQRQEEKRKRQIENFDLALTLYGHLDWIFALATTPNSQILVSGSDDFSIKIWHLKTGREILSLASHNNYVRSLVISPDGRFLVSGSYQEIKIWELVTAKELRSFKGHSDWVCSLAITPDGQTLISSSGDRTIKLWDFKTGREIATWLGHCCPVACLSISPNGQILASGSGDNTIQLWELSTGTEIQTLIGHSDCIRSLAITPDGQTLVSGSEDHTIKLWQLNTGRQITTLTGHRDTVYALFISSDGQTLVSASGDRTIKVWQLSTGKELSTLRGHSSSVFSLAITPDGQTLISGSEDNTIQIWRLP